MTRLLDRLSGQNYQGAAWRRLWDKTCTTIESLFDSVFTVLLTIPDIQPVTVSADYTGAVLTGQLPRNVIAKLFSNETEVTTSATWSRTVVSGDITCTMGAATGILNITGLGSTAVVTLSATYLGTTKSRTITITKQVGSAPSTGSGGGTSTYDTTFASFNAATHATVSDELTVTAGSGGIVTLSAPLEVYTAAATPAGTYEVYGIWQWDTTGGGVWADLGTEVASNPDTIVEHLGGAAFDMTEGAVSVSYSHTGRTPGSSYKYRLRARNASGTRTMYLSGTASAVGS